MLGQLIVSIVEQMKNRRMTGVGERFIADFLYGNSTQRRLGRRLPDVHIAANGCDAGIP